MEKALPIIKQKAPTYDCGGLTMDRSAGHSVRKQNSYDNSSFICRCQYEKLESAFVGVALITPSEKARELPLSGHHTKGLMGNGSSDRSNGL